MEVVLKETFVSNDGVTFESRQECVNHELAASTIQMWDDAEHPVSDIDGAYLVKLSSAEDVVIFKDASSVAGTGCITDPGIYYREYDEYFGEEMWFNIDERIADLGDQLARLQELKAHLS